MNTKVYKYPLSDDGGGHASIQVPAGAKIIHADIQGDMPQIWCVVEPDNAVTETLYFTIVGTGFDVPPDSVHIATWYQGPFVWHLFQEDV